MDALTDLLPGNWSSRLHYAYPMISESRVGLRNLGLRHVAGHALLLAHRAGGFLPTIRNCVSAAGPMTRETLGVVGSRVVLQLGVRIVTGDATQPRIVLVMASTVKNPIGLKSNIVDSALSRHDHYLIEASMA